MHSLQLRMKVVVIWKIICDMECIGTTVYIGEEWVNCRYVAGNNRSYPQNCQRKSSATALFP
jgi:hypothetical protein